MIKQQNHEMHTSLADGNMSPKGRSRHCGSGEKVKNENFVD